MPSNKEWRIYFLLAFIFLVYGVVACRLFFVQVLKHGVYDALAQSQYQLWQKIIPQRGEIFVQDKYGETSPLATLRQYPLVFLAPSEIKDQEAVVNKLSEILSLDRQILSDKVSRVDNPYVPVKSKIDDQAADKIKALNLKGVYVVSENLRWYPQGDLAAHILGFVGYKDDMRLGQYGLEGYYEELLAGKAGVIKVQKDALGNAVLSEENDMQLASDGDQLYLTIDPNIQYMAEEKLKAVLEQWQSEAGSVIVMDPQSGAISAMASFPNFNPNEYNKVNSIDDFLNPVTQKLYEPGSIFKPITMSAGLDSGKISPGTSYVDTGAVQVGGKVITNAAQRSYGLSDMSKVMEKSINTGAVFVEQTIGRDVFKKYIDAFGLNRPTGIDLAGEIGGNFNNLKYNREIDFATASFGQGVAVTPLEIVTAIAAIANGGEMMKPYLVKKIAHPDGQTEEISPQPIRQVITKKTATQLTDMLVNTVQKGYDKIKIKDYLIAGKTGTAQIPNADKSGYSDETIHSFVGYAPAYNPKFLIFIKMDKPKGINFASDSLSATFAEMAQYLFNYYEIPPDMTGR